LGWKIFFVDYFWNLWFLHSVFAVRKLFLMIWGIFQPQNYYFLNYWKFNLTRIFFLNFFLFKILFQILRKFLVTLMRNFHTQHYFLHKFSWEILNFSIQILQYFSYFSQNLIFPQFIFFSIFSKISSNFFSHIFKSQLKFPQIYFIFILRKKISTNKINISVSANKRRNKRKKNYKFLMNELLLVSFSKFIWIFIFLIGIHKKLFNYFSSLIKVHLGKEFFLVFFLPLHPKK